ncbi:hypothetical protein [Curtobacterium sp. MCBD17_008]|uniref:hypothetical protein n=1 Tax=Curtobacterium sp. MCBD17_008 TaxID=2175656 RepID=UPI000DA92435|nr:hypothetical protein [Curtobacterium sp. MCBD17_008]PZE89971.1 hypothetical protein DEI95_13200 [Curtobacterium sp. MCBD17_008]
MTGVDAVVAHVAELLESFGVAAGSRAEVETYLRGALVPAQPTPSAEPMVPLRAVVAVLDHYDNGDGECEPEDRWRLFRDMRSLLASDQVPPPPATPETGR